ncbi:hypothetical protein GE061_003541 [Apolygus lucorum]|uniref:SEFIR domain-containing protein n=1 Tax=Apolygus lucorum TaxID=248454 RepID=A0A8S9X4X2_APOLU|nr:hypothetical protein GE061_003541 [Apolygus lucorum]
MDIADLPKAESYISHAALKLPQFWHQDPELCLLETTGRRNPDTDQRPFDKQPRRRPVTIKMSYQIMWLLMFLSTADGGDELCSKVKQLEVQGCFKRSSRTEIKLDAIKRFKGGLEFKLRNLTAEINITLIMRIRDSRCTSGGAWNWTRADLKSICLWKKSNLNVTTDKNQKVFEQYEAPVSSNIFLVLGLLAGIVTVGIATIVVRLIIKQKSYKPVPFETASLNEIQPKTSSIFLLYARDCDIFMEAMKKFRNLLETSTLLPVHDIWDERRLNDLDMQGDLWALNHLEPEDPDVKVILVATPVSKAIEKFIVKRNPISDQFPRFDSLYTEPHSLDEVFVSAFTTCIRWTQIHPDQCRKFIVTKLQTVGCAQNQFSSTISLCTILVLPIHRDLLFEYVVGRSPREQDFSLQDLQSFETSIEEYDDFVRLHPNYEENLLANI